MNYINKSCILNVFTLNVDLSALDVYMKTSIVPQVFWFRLLMFFIKFIKTYILNWFLYWYSHVLRILAAKGVKF